MFGSDHSQVCRKKTFDAAEHLVVFLDFLGMSERMLDEHLDINGLNSWMHELDRLATVLREQSKAISDGRTLVRGFSDCFLIARPWCVNEVCLRRNRDWLRLRVARLQVEALLSGYMIRGAASCGLFASGKFAMAGEALVRSARLEMNVARFPRVILDAGLAARLPGLRKYFLKDEDGYWFVDFLRVRSERWTKEDVRGALGGILGRELVPSIRMKNNWLRNYANSRELFP